MTNNAANTSFEQSTLPFGTALNAESSGFSNQVFTSYERSDVANLDYAVNRTYSPGQGRFTTVDPIGMASVSVGNPQSFNLFTYVRNAPTDLVDPSGLVEGPPRPGCLFNNEKGKWECPSSDTGIGGAGGVGISEQIQIDNPPGTDEPTDGGGGGQAIEASNDDNSRKTRLGYQPNGNRKLKECIKRVTDRASRELAAMPAPDLFNLTIDDLLSAGPGAIVGAIAGGILGGISGAIGGFVLGYVASLVGTWAWRILVQFVVNSAARIQITSELVIGTLNCYAVFGHEGF